MTPGAPLLSVVVCTYNRAALLPGCLDSLVWQTLSPDHFEVIIVDNNSTDATREVAEGYAARHSHFCALTEPVQGLSNARNRGWRDARGTLVAYLDDDAKATPAWCEGIVRAFDRVHPRPSAVGGRILPWFDTSPPAWFCEALETRSWGDEAEFLQGFSARYGFSGSNMAFEREVLQAFGGFRPDFGMIGGKLWLGEETELFCRIYAARPFFWYDPAIVVSHLVPDRNMRLGYRLHRAFLCGAAVARIEQGSRGVLHYMRGLLEVTSFLAGLPLLLAKSGQGLKAEAIRRFEEICGRLGYFFGPRR